VLFKLTPLTLSCGGTIHQKKNPFRTVKKKAQSRAVAEALEQST